MHETRKSSSPALDPFSESLSLNIFESTLNESSPKQIRAEIVTNIHGTLLRISIKNSITKGSFKYSDQSVFESELKG